MQIPKEEFIALDVPDTPHKWLFWGMARKHFCPVMTRRNLCKLEEAGSCSLCAPFIKEAYRLEMADGNPVGLLVWRLRDQAARAAERPVPTPKDGTNNPFERYLETLP